MIRDFRYAPLTAIGPAFVRTWAMSVFTLESIKKMLLGMISPKNLSGPITIAKVATASAKSGWESYLAFLAFFSVSLGVLNLLPIPVLDGGHILFSLPELMTGKPLPRTDPDVGLPDGLVPGGRCYGAGAVQRFTPALSFCSCVTSRQCAISAGSARSRGCEVATNVVAAMLSVAAITTVAPRIRAGYFLSI